MYKKVDIVLLGTISIFSDFLIGHYDKINIRDFFISAPR